MQDILLLLQNKMPEFSRGQRRLAQYILESYDKAAFMTASKLGKAVNVSESTVVRFAVELGYDGYPSMQKAMQEMVVNRLTSVQRIGVANDRIGDQDVVSKVLREAIDRLRRSLDIGEFPGLLSELYVPQCAYRYRLGFQRNVRADCRRRF